MMNIFIMILMAIFMVGFYMYSSPSVRTPEQETEYAINRSDLRSIVECAVAMHNAQINDTEFEDVCISQNEIESDFICLNARGAKTECEIVRNRKPAASYIVTTTGVLDDSNFNNIMEILESDYSDAGTFGIFMDGRVISGSGSANRTVPKAIISEFKLENGQLIYMTEYEMPDATREFTGVAPAEIKCPAGLLPTYRFGRWQCIGHNTKTDCGGDTIWDSEVGKCVADETRKPLCASQQTAVLIDDVWECVNPFPSKTCPDKQIARLNYTTLEWECVSDPTITETVKKCKNISNVSVSGGIGATLGVSTITCTDCERMITNTDTCTAICVPDPAKINDPKCYAGKTSDCTGDARAFYFGFPSQTYAARVSEVDGKLIPFDKTHSQNRRFNCMDCGTGVIDKEKSVTPYTAVCKY